MQTFPNLFDGFSSALADAPQACREWTESPISLLGDAALIDAVAAAIERPKRDARSSFLTHAPLELAARAALLPMAAPRARDQVRRRIAAIAVEYRGAGEEIEDCPGQFASVTAAIEAARDALRQGDANTLDGALLYLADRVSPLAIRAALAEDLIPMLGAAAHAPILLAEIPRLEARLEKATHLLRAPLRLVAKLSHARLSWFQEAGEAVGTQDGAALFDALRDPTQVLSPSSYIAPTMLAVEANGFARDRLSSATATLSVDNAMCAILRAGALSMLHDDPHHAPYGWSHALTMPLGILGCADVVGDKTMLVRVAATHALGFRATLGKARLVDAPPPRPRSDEILGVAPIEAAGAVYHADAGKIAAIRTSLATRAAAHRDAHLAKYTLAAFDAAARDRGASRLYLAAAAYLGAWWDANPDASFE